MKTLEQTIRTVRRRGLVNEAIHHGGVGAACGLAVALAVLALDRLAPLAVPSVTYVVLPAIGTVIGMAYAVVNHPDTFAVALRIDRSLHLKDRVATAHALMAKMVGPSGSGPTHDDGFAAIVGRDAEQLAGKLDARSIAPLRISQTWAIAAGLGLILWLGHAYLPSATWAATDAPEPEDETVAVSPEEREREREDLRQRIEDSIERFKRDTMAGDEEATERELPMDRRVRDQLEALERLAHQLSGEGADDVDIEQARDESAARLNELAEQISREARRDREAAERLTERFAGIEPPETPMSAREFREALQRGDFGRAADLLDEQLNRKDELAGQTREDLAEHLRELDEQLEDRSREDRQQTEEGDAQLEQVLRDHDLDDELIRDLLDGERLTAEEMERLLHEEGIDEELANRLARELEQLRDERDVLDQLERDAEAIREALRDAAEELDQPDDAPPPDEPRDEPDPPDPIDPIDPADQADPTDPLDPEVPDRDEREEGERVDEQEPREDRPADEQPTDRDDAEHEAAEADDAERDPDAEDEAREGDDGPPTEEREEVADEPREGEDEAREVAEERPADHPDAEQEAATDEPDAEGEAQPVADPDSPDADPDDPDAAEAPEVGREAGPMDELPQPGEQPGADDQAMEETAGEEDGEMRRSASERLRELEERRQRSREREQISEEMIERAREMIDRMDPEQRRELAEQMQREMEDADPSAPDGPGAAGDEAGMAEQPTTVGEADEFEPRETEDIDLTPDDDEFDRVLAEWLSDEELTPDAEGVQRRDVSEERVREARRVAERAVEDAAVPSRYHQFIRRYFQRLEERTESADNER